MNARPLGAACVGAAGAALLLAGGAPWPAAVLAAAGAAVFTGWRAMPGVWTGFGLLATASLAAWPGGPPFEVSPLRPLWPWLAGLEVFGIATIVVVRQRRDPQQLSRRLVGSWLASTGAVLLGVTLSGGHGAAAAASALVAGGLLYKLGVVPAHAWAPMLWRHPDRRIARLAVVAFALPLAVLWRAWPLPPGESGSAITTLAMAGTAVPWALWRARRQWHDDRPCARTYVAVAVVSLALLVLLAVSAARVMR